MAKKYSAIILWALLLLLAVQCARAANWGTFAITDDCLEGKRKWWSRLYNINGDWDAACKNTPATVNGVYFERPSNCVNRGIEGEFGEFYIDDTTCP